MQLQHNVICVLLQCTNSFIMLVPVIPGHMMLLQSQHCVCAYALPAYTINRIFETLQHMSATDQNRQFDDKSFFKIAARQNRDISVIVHAPRMSAVEYSTSATTTL